MIYIDDRKGSAELQRYFRPFNMLTEIQRLEFGDFMFQGRGPEGECLVGIERKALGDMLQCIKDGRFSAHQLPGLVNSYQFSYLIVEGMFRRSRDGFIEEYQRGSWRPLRFMYRELSNYLTTIELKTPIKVRITSLPGETAATVCDLWSWFNRKDWDHHTAHEGLQQVDLATKFSLNMFKKPSPVRQVAALMPGVGNDKSRTFDKAFTNVYDLVNAGERQLAALDGVGPKTAKKIFNWFRGLK